MMIRLIPFKNYLYIVLATLLSNSLMAQSNKSDLKNDKHWSYIDGEQRAINDSNRVNYWRYPFESGARVKSFNNLKLIDLNDSEFIKVHLDANQVYEAQKTVTGPPFFISKYEVSNNDYLEFVLI